MRARGDGIRSDLAAGLRRARSRRCARTLAGCRGGPLVRLRPAARSTDFCYRGGPSIRARRARSPSPIAATTQVELIHRARRRRRPSTATSWRRPDGRPPAPRLPADRLRRGARRRRRRRFGRSPTRAVGPGRRFVYLDAGRLTAGSVAGARRLRPPHRQLLRPHGQRGGATWDAVRPGRGPPATPATDARRRCRGARPGARRRARPSMRRDLLGDRHRAVPAAGATERDRQVGLPLGHEGRDEQGEQRRRAGRGTGRSSAGPGRSRAPPRPARERAELLDPVGVGQEAAVEHHVGVGGDALLVAEGHDPGVQGPGRAGLGERLEDPVAQLVHVEVGRVDDEVGDGPDRLQQLPLPLDRVGRASRPTAGGGAGRPCSATPASRWTRRGTACGAAGRTSPATAAPAARPPGAGRSRRRGRCAGSRALPAPSVSSATLGISDGGRLSMTNQPTSSRASAAVERPAPDRPATTTTSPRPKASGGVGDAAGLVTAPPPSPCGGRAAGGSRTRPRTPPPGPGSPAGVPAPPCGSGGGRCRRARSRSGRGVGG